MIVVGINVASAQTRTLWQEDFSSYSANDVPSGGTYNYVCKDGGSATKIYNENTGGGTAPELLVSRSGGTFYATVPLSNIEGDLTLTYKTNNSTLKVESTTEGVTGGVVEKFKGTHTVTFSGITTSMTSITIVFTATTNSNVRLDDILLTYTPPSNRTLSSISLSGTYPTTFKVGDTFSHEGMTVTATYDDNTTEDVTEDASFEGYDMSTAGDQEVTVSYTEGEETKTATYDITVKNIQLTGITLSGDYPTTFDVGDTFSHEGMTVTATYDDNTTEDVTADASFNGYDMSTAGDQEVTVSYTKGEVTKTATYNITVKALTGDAYALVTSVDDLADGDNVIIVNKDAGKAISTTQATNNRPATGITFDADGNAIVPSSTDIQVFTLEGDANGWYFNTGSGYIYAASSSSNHLKTETEADDNAKASISISDGDATIQFQGSNTRNLLKYNSGSSIFACYSSGQSPVQIYSKPVNKTLTGIMLSGDYPTTFFVGDEFSFGETGTVTAVYDDNSTKVVTKLATFSGYDMNTAGNQTVTVSYTERGVTKEQTYEITVNNRALTSITLSGDYPTTFNVGDTFSHEGMTVTATYDDNTSEDVTADATFEGYDMSTAGTQTVTVSYTKADVTKTATYEITVNAVAVTGISLDIIEATLVVGQTKKINATIEPDNATVNLIWTSEDESVATVDQDGNVTAVGAGTIIIKAAAADNDDIFGACTIHVVELKTEPYSLVADVSDLAEGDEVIIVNTAAGKAMSSTQNSNNRAATGVTFDEAGYALVSNSGEIQVFTLEGNSEGWYFNTGDGYIYAASNSSNQLKTKEEKDDNARAVITITDEGTSVVFQRTNGRNVLQYNSGSDIFSCYASASQSPVQIYKKGATSATTYSLVVGEEETPFESLSLTQELPAHTKFYIKDNMGNEYHSADAQSELIIIAENHENLPTSADGKDFYLKKANTWVFTLTEASDGLMLTVSPETEGETKYMLSGYLQESNDVFDENLKLTKEMTSTTEEFYFTRSDDYGLTNLTPTTFNAPEDRRYWIFSEDDPTVEFIAGEIRGSYTVGEVGTYTFTIDLTNNTVTAEKTVEYVDLTISSYEWATFVTPSAVQFPDDVTAYIITEITGGNAKAEQITEAPAGTPVIVNGAEGIHKLPYIGKSSAIENNELLASDGNVTGDGTIYVLAVEGGQPGFAPLANGKKLSAGKAYLQVDNASGAKINLIFDGESSDIRGIESTVDFSDGDWYNLQGVKVTNPQRGIYIHNGKKVVIK